MIKLGNLILNGTPRIAVGMKDHADSQILIDAKNKGLDIVEIRIDQFSNLDKKYVLSEIAKFKKFPTIATIRSKKEGGNWRLSEEKRLELFKSIIPKVDAVDVELSSKEILPKIVNFAHKHKKIVVISYHNFDRTPLTADLTKILDSARAIGADIVKIAVMALKRKDVQALARFTLSNSDKNIITISMGAEGIVSRVLFPALGSLVTYAYVGESTAPGQLPYSNTFDMLRMLYQNYNEEKITALKLLQNI